MTGSAYQVYVIEMERGALHERDSRGDYRGWLYVGYTAKTGEERLSQHQTAERLAARVFKRMTDPRRSWLRPDLALYSGPFATDREARRNERRLHNRLVSDGYRVFGDRGRKRGKS